MSNTTLLEFTCHGSNSVAAHPFPASLPHGAVCWSAVCDVWISWSYLHFVINGHFANEIKQIISDQIALLEQADREMFCEHMLFLAE